MFGVAEDHDSNPIKLALSGMRRRGAKFITINPVRTGYSAIADEWLGIRPGTDGLFVLSLIHELLRADKIDFAYLGRYTNAAWLVIQAPGAADDGLFARNAAGEPLVLDAAGGISAHSNGFQTCRALHLLQILIGTIDVPGGWRYKSPYPKPAPPGPKPAGKPGQVAAGKPLAGAPLGYVMTPEDLLLDDDGQPS